MLSGFYQSFQSTPSVWRETITSLAEDKISSISIHSLRVEGDSLDAKQNVVYEFQSTPSVWRETATVVATDSKVPISIHSLRVEGDIAFEIINERYARFQSTPSVWRETLKPPEHTDTRSISIHSLRVEGDNLCNGEEVGNDDFNPLPPCGGRPRSRQPTQSRLPFQSTPSVWRETVQCDECGISTLNFNPLPPCGGRRWYRYAIYLGTVFQSTPSVWRETGNSVVTLLPPAISIHSLRVEGDFCGRKRGNHRSISIHSLRVEGDFTRKTPT